MMTGSPLAVSVQVRAHGDDRDCELQLADEQVTVADVLRALELPGSDIEIDGQLIAHPATTAAAAVVAAGSRVVVGDRERLPWASRVAVGTRLDDDAVVEVSVVGGLNAGRVAHLAPGLYRITPDSQSGSSGWFVEVDPKQSDSPPRPWHRSAQSLEAVVGEGHVVAFAEPVESESGGSIVLHRPPRALPPDRIEPLRIQPAPATVRPPSALSWATLLAPLPIALLMAFFFRPLFAIFAAMGPVMALGRWYESRRRFRRHTQQRSGLVAHQQSELEMQVLDYIEASARLRWLHNPHVAELWRRSRERSVRLWERRPATAGYLTVMVGIGEDQVEIETEGADQDAEVHFAVQRPRTLRCVPHVIDIAAATGVGLHGEREPVLRIARSIVLQLASLQGPSDLTLGVLCSDATAAEWDWVKWLPHCSRALVSTSATAIAREIGSTAGNADTDSHVRLVIVDDPTADVAAIERAAHATGASVRILALAAQPTSLPAVCSTLLHASGNSVEIASPELAGRRTKVHPVGITGRTASAWSRSLASLVDPELRSIEQRSSGPVGLMGLLETTSATEIVNRWARRSAGRSPRAVIGLGEDGVVAIDLADDGPHGLVAGTTGSGKSELLRSLVLAAAVDCPPDQLNFVLVDFKGGGAFDACRQLPHVAGLITDLDEALVERAITSLRAELQRREVLFRKLGVSSYEEAVELAEAQSASAVPGVEGVQGSLELARVLIVIDEFAVLATDYSELMAAFIDLAARGRSLGMHLLLATQRPSGVVDQKIRANTNLRIALRVQDAYDSQDVVGVPDAASIDRRTPGRAIFSIGGDTTKNVQTAYCGGVDRQRVRCTVQPLQLFPAARPEEDERAGGQTELRVLVNALIDAGTAHGSKVQPLWTEPLPRSLEWLDLGGRVLASPDNAQGCAIGLVDLPEQQRQAPWRWDPDSGSLALFGASASCLGKTLVAVGASLVETAQTDPPHLYVIDGDAGNVKALAALSQTGAYITLAEPDRVERLITLFESTLADRRTPGGATHRMVLLIDNLAALLGTYDDLGAAALIERLSALARDGAAQRVHVVIAARTARDIAHRLVQQMPNRLTLNLADPNGYLVLGLRAQDLVDLPEMRAIDLVSQRVLQLVEPPSLTSRKGNAGSSSPQPLSIGEFPARVALEELPVASLDDQVLTVPVGIESAHLGVASLALHQDEHALIAGSNGMGRSSALLTIIAQLVRGQVDVDIVRVAPRRSPLAADDLAGTLIESEDHLNELVAERSRELVIVVDDAGLINEGLAAALEAMSGRHDGVRVVAGVAPDFARSMRAWTTCIRQSGVGLLIGGQSTDGDIFRVRLPTTAGQGRIAGRGYLVSRGKSQIVQIASP